MKKRVDVEKLVQWTYRDGLTIDDAGEGFVLDGGVDGWVRAAETLRMLGCFVQGSGTPLSQQRVAENHPDAVAVNAAVLALPDEQVDWTASADHLLGPNAPWLDGDEPRLRHTFIRSAILVIMHARMATRPQWHAEPARLVRVIDEGTGRVAVVLANGKPGRFPKGGLKPGARCPLRLEPSAADIARWRADYALWHAALDVLALELKDRLDDFEPLPPAASFAPWREPDIQPVVHEDGRKPAAPRKKAPVRAGPPAPRPRSDKGRVIPLEGQVAKKT